MCSDNDNVVSSTTDSSVSATEQDDVVDEIEDLSPLFKDTPLEAVDRAVLIRLQQADPAISPLYHLVDKTEQPYLLRAGVLVREWQDKLFSARGIFPSSCRTYSTPCQTFVCSS